MLHERNQQIVSLFVDEHLSLDGIGRKFGLTRESIRQIINKELTKEQYQIILNENKRLRKRKPQLSLCECGNKKSKVSKNCQACYVKRIQIIFNEEQKKERRAYYSKKYYYANILKFKINNRIRYLKRKEKMVVDKL